MIFVTVGTWRNGFDRLLRAVDRLITDGTIREEVIAQTGCSSYRPQHMTAIRFCSPQQFVTLISQSRLVLSHAGIGTILHAVKQRKPIIVVPRLKILHEVDSNHQFTTAEQFEKLGLVLAAYKLSELPARLRQAESFIPAEGRAPDRICMAVDEFLKDVVAAGNRRRSKNTGLFARVWPYKILQRDDGDIQGDLRRIMHHFVEKGQSFDTVVFIPNAGIHLRRIFAEICNGELETRLVTVRRPSSVAKTGRCKKFVFERRWLSNLMRHCEVFIRLVKHKLGIKPKRGPQPVVDFDISNRKVLLIDDSVDTGTTMQMVKSALLKRGASSVATACISNHLLPDEIEVDFAVHRYALLRTPNSRDYLAR